MELYCGIDASPPYGLVNTRQRPSVQSATLTRGAGAGAGVGSRWQAKAEYDRQQAVLRGAVDLPVSEIQKPMQVFYFTRSFGSRSLSVYVL